MRIRIAAGILSVLIFFSVSCGRPPAEKRGPVLEPSAMELYYRFQAGRELPEAEFYLPASEIEGVVDYAQYGSFLNAGTEQYRYAFEDRGALMQVLPMGVFPNQRTVLQHPQYLEYFQQGKIYKNHWQALESEDALAAFFSWALAHEEQGVKTFFTAVALERAGHILPALAGYQAVIIHFPASPCYAADGSFVWYPSQAALGNIRRICWDYPQLGLWYEGGEIEVINAGDPNPRNHIVKTTPGKFIKQTLEERREQMRPLEEMEIIQRRGSGRIRLVQYENGHWQILKDGEPFFIRGINYMPTPIGLGPKSDPGYFHLRWMREDRNEDGILDIPYQTWIDSNRNGRQDAEEPAVGDFQILKDMGANAIRIFNLVTEDYQYDADFFNKELLRDLYENYGIGVIMGDHLGAYTVGTGATWEEGTDYRDPEQRARMKQIVRQMVLDLRDEPFVLIWLLGNENNMSPDYTGVNATRTNAATYPETYAKFLNEVAAMIKELDPHRPVAVGNVELNLIDVYNEYAPEIDILGINSYRGKDGFGTLWEDAKRFMDRPVLITEYGCDAYHEGVGVDERAQREYLESNHRDIVFNQAGGEFAGNSIGGIIFEFLDEWWKDTHSGDPEDAQTTHATFRMPFPDGWSHEEWLGIVGQGSGKYSPFKRVPREAYYYFKEVWN